MTSSDDDKRRSTSKISQKISHVLTENTVTCYSIKDTKADFWDIPFFAKSDLFATRKFTMDIRAKNSNSMLANFKEDFELYRIAFYDQKTSKFINKPILIIKGSEIETTN